MKRLFLNTLLLLFFSINTQARNGYGRYNSEPEYADVEVGINGGLAFFDSETPLFFKAQLLYRFADHVQVAPMITYLKGDYNKAIGGGVNLNFPIGKRRTYFYPGAQIGYYSGGAFTYGVHIGINIAITPAISLNLEPEMIIARTAKAAPGSFYPVSGGIRINL